MKSVSLTVDGLTYNYECHSAQTLTEILSGTVNLIAGTDSVINQVEVFDYER